MNKKKIIFILPSDKYLGGIYHDTITTALKMDKYMNVKIISFKDQYPNRLYPGFSKNSKLTSYKLSNKNEIIKWFDFNTWRIAAKSIIDEADIVYIPYWTFFLAPIVLYIAFKSKKGDVKVIIDFHNIFDHDSGMTKRYISLFFLKRIAKNSDLNIFHSKNTYQVFKKTIRKNSNSLIIPLGALDNIERLENPSKLYEIYNLSKNTNYILMFGMVRKYKGLKYAIKAMKYLKMHYNSNYKLLIVGEIWQDISEELDIIKKYNLENQVIFIDKFIPDSHIIPFFKISKLIIYPYLSATQSGSIRFAFRCKKPIIATKVGQFKEILKNKENAILISSKKPKELANAIIELNENEILANKISKKGNEYYKTYFSSDKIIKDILYEIRNF